MHFFVHRDYNKKKTNNKYSLDSLRVLRPDTTQKLIQVSNQQLANYTYQFSQI